MYPDNLYVSASSYMVCRETDAHAVNVSRASRGEPADHNYSRTFCQSVCAHYCRLKARCRGRCEMYSDKAPRRPLSQDRAPACFGMCLTKSVFGAVSGSSHGWCREAERERGNPLTRTCLPDGTGQSQSSKPKLPSAASSGGGSPSC